MNDKIIQKSSSNVIKKIDEKVKENKFKKSQKIIKKEPSFPVEDKNKKEVKVKKSLKNKAVTHDTHDTLVTYDTHDTHDYKKLCVTCVNCDKDIKGRIFEKDLLWKIYGILATSEEGFTYDEIAKRLNKNSNNIRKAVSLNNNKGERFIIKKPDGKISVIFLSHMSQIEIIQEIEKLNTEKAVEEERIKLEAKVKDKIKNLREDVLIEAKKFLEFSKKSLMENVRKGEHIIYIDFTEIMEFSTILSDELLSNPEEALRIIEQAIEESGLINNCRVRIKNLPETTDVLVEDMRSRHLNNFISIKGKVLQRSEARPQVVNAKFECPSCGTIISVLQIEKKFREPVKCSCGRRGGFKLISKEMVDTARFVIQDLQEIAKSSSPSRLNCFVKEDLASSSVLNNILQAGNDVVLNGILKEVPVPLPSGGLSTRFEFAVEVNYVELAEESIELDNLTEEEIEEFDSLANRIDDKGIEELTPSYSPVVKGYDYAKQALILYSCNKLNNPGIDEERNKSNILFIGDPSTSKSVLARFLTEISIGAKKVVGGSSSAVGITGSVTKDEFLGGWMINPGALVLAKDVLFLEELNTMEDEEKSKIQDAMESQYVDITKANVSGRYKVKTGIVSCANPVAGHFLHAYDKKEIVKQFKIPTPILSRFDTIFIFRDTQKEDLDFEISMSMKKRRSKLLETEFDKVFLKKFFYYTKARKEPEMSVEFEILASRVYSLLRKLSGKDNNVNARLSEAMDRMTIASAKLRGSEIVEEKDLERVINILAHSYLTTPDYDTIKDNLKEREQLEEMTIRLEEMKKKQELSNMGGEEEQIPLVKI